LNYAELLTYIFTNGRSFQSVSFLIETTTVRLSFHVCVYPLLVQISDVSIIRNNLEIL